MASPQTLQDRTLEQACTMVLFMALELSDKIRLGKLLPFWGR